MNKRIPRSNETYIGHRTANHAEYITVVHFPDRVLINAQLIFNEFDN